MMVSNYFRCFPTRASQPLSPLLILIISKLRASRTEKRTLFKVCVSFIKQTIFVFNHSFHLDIMIVFDEQFSLHRLETLGDRKEMTVPIDMDYMGIDEDTDFEMELSKDFIREVEKFYRDNGCIPTADELKRLMEKYDYGCHPAPDGDTEPFD